MSSEAGSRAAPCATRLRRRRDRPASAARRRAACGRGRSRRSGESTRAGVDRAERVAALAEHDAEVVLRFGMPGVERHGALQRGQRAIEIARPPERGAEMIVRVEELRRHGRRLAEAGDGLSRPAELAERETEPIAGAGHVRRPLERGFERCRSAGPVTAAARARRRGRRAAWHRRRRRPPSTVPRRCRDARRLRRPAAGSRACSVVRAVSRRRAPMDDRCRHDPFSPVECHDGQPRLARIRIVR